MAKEAFRKVPSKIRRLYRFDNAWEMDMASFLDLRLPKYFRAIELRWHIVQARTLDEVGSKLGLSRERVRQMEAKATRMLKQFVRLGFHAYFLRSHQRDLGVASIDGLGIAPRSYNALKSQRLHTIGQVAESKPCQLLAIKNFGQTSLADTRGALAAFGMSLAPCQFHGTSCGQYPRPNYRPR